MIGHYYIAQQLEFLLVAVEIEAVVERDDKAGPREYGQAIIYYCGDLVDVPLNANRGSAIILPRGAESAIF
jgi:hypothetical protein